MWHKMLAKSILISFCCFVFVNTIYAKNSHSEKSHAHYDECIEIILNFWFDYSHHPQSLFERAIWWQKDPKFDYEIEIKFSHMRLEAIAGKMDHWLTTPKGTLAYVILIDQFSRNLFRQTDKMYQYDYLALAAAKHAIDNQFDQSLLLTERVFLYMPFEHSEQLSEQKRSVELFEHLVQETPRDVKALAKQYLSHAKEHYHIVEKFHRFPHRNQIMGRESTKEEIEFLVKENRL